MDREIEMPTACFIAQLGGRAFLHQDLAKICSDQVLLLYQKEQNLRSEVKSVITIEYISDDESSLAQQFSY